MPARHKSFLICIRERSGLPISAAGHTHPWLAEYTRRPDTARATMLVLPALTITAPPMKTPSLSRGGGPPQANRACIELRPTPPFNRHVLSQTEDHAKLSTTCSARARSAPPLPFAAPPRPHKVRQTTRHAADKDRMEDKAQSYAKERRHFPSCPKEECTNAQREAAAFPAPDARGHGGQATGQPAEERSNRRTREENTWLAANDHAPRVRKTGQAPR